MDHVPYRLAAVSSLLALDRDPDVRELVDLSEREFQVLMDIGANGPVRAVNIMRRSRLSVSTVSRAVNELQRSGYVAGETDAVDMRASLLRLTEKGDLVYARLVEICRARAELIDKVLPADERRVLVEALRRIENTAETFLAEHAEAAIRDGRSIPRDQRDLLRAFRSRSP